MNNRILALSLLPCAFLSAQRGGPVVAPRGNTGPIAGGVVDRPIGGVVSPGFASTAGGGNFVPGRHSTGDRALAMPPRPGGAPALTKISYFEATRRTHRPVIFPPELPQCTAIPDAAYWGRRNLTAEFQWLARAGILPVTPVDPKAEEVVDFTWKYAGWKAYGFAVPPGGRLQVELQHHKPAWFRLMAVDRWGKPGAGMLQAAIAYRPTLVTLTNPGKKAEAVYIIVDDPAWWSDKDDPYKLIIRRDWDPAAVDLSSVKMVAGLWGASPSVSAEFRHPSLTGPAVFPH